MNPITVFISYSHDSEAHRDKALALSERLRDDGINTILDQYVNGSPEQGWPRWMLDQLDAATFVLVVCTETYYRRFRGHEAPGKGKGVDWEGALITQELYDARSRTLKFVPVFLSDAAPDWVPEPLRSISYYTLTSETAYQSLYDFLLGQAAVAPRPVGKIKPKPRRKGAPLSFGEPPAQANPSPAKVEAREPNQTAQDFYQRALRYLSDENYDEALNALNQTIALDPTLAFAYYNRGLTHYYQHDEALAIRDFNRALELGFRDALLFRNRGNAFSRKGDVAPALADYAQAIALDPQNVLAYLNRGQVYENTLQLELAISDYKTVLNLVSEPQLQEHARNRLLAMGVRVPTSQPSPALAIWQKKLAFLQVEEAKAADAEQKFSIQQRIEEAQAKIQELGG